MKHLLESSLPSRDLMPSTQDRGVYELSRLLVEPHRGY